MADEGFMSRFAKAIGIADDPVEKRAPGGGPVGSIDVTDFGGYIFEGDRRVGMTGKNRFAYYDEMLRDVTIVAAGVRAFLNLISGADWSVSPPPGYEDDPQAIEIAETFYDSLFDMRTSWATVTRKLAAFRFFGFALLEWTAKMRPDGKIGFENMGHRPQRSIAKWLRDNDLITAVVQRNSKGQEVTIPRGQLVYAVDDSLSDSPEGLGLFHHLGETVDRLRYFLQIEETGYETDLRGIPVARAPLGELKAMVDREKAKGEEQGKAAMARRDSMLAQLRTFVEKHVRNAKTGLLLPSDVFTSTDADKTKRPSSTAKWGAELMTGESQGFADMAKSIIRMTEEIARVLGTEHLLLGADGKGSLALSQDKTGTFYLNVTSTLTDMVEVVERDILEPFMVLNSYPDDLTPVVGVSEITETDIEKVTAALQRLAAAGATLLPGDPAIGEIRDRLGLSRPLEIEELDASLLPDRNTTPADDEGVKDAVEKRRYIRSRRYHRLAKRQASMQKRRAA